MANSESEDFESADEGVEKPECRKESQSAESLCTRSSKRTPAQGNGNSCSSSQSEVSSEVPDEIFSNRSVEPLVSSTSAVPSSESLGAKPKVLQRNHRKYNSKEQMQHLNENVEDLPDENTSSKSVGRNTKKQGPLKLGVKIAPASTCATDQNSPPSTPNQLKDKAKSKVTWCKYVRDAPDAVEKPIKPLLDKLSSVEVEGDDALEQESQSSENPEQSSGWGSWGTWGVGTILSGASRVTSQVTQSLTSAIETGLGAVGPEEMARINVDEKKVSLEVDDAAPVEETTGPDSPEAASSGLLSMGSVLRFMESTGGMIVASGLNTLETIGKKTMDVLQEGDPGLKRKRAFLSGELEKPCLSQILKEARLKADVEDLERAKEQKSSKAHFETLFDDFNGMVHLEALEMLSHTCQMKLEAKLVQLSGPQLIDFQRTIALIKEQCELPDEDDEDDDEDRGSLEILERDLAVAMRDVVSVTYAKLITISEETDNLLNTMKTMNEDEGPHENDEWVIDPQSGLEEIHEQAISALARFTAAVTEHFFRVAALLMVLEERSSTAEAHCLVMMTTVLCSRVSSVAARFAELLSATANALGSTHINHNDVNSLITNVFLEASNSSSYIQDASNLLIPVLQLGAVQ